MTLDPNATNRMTCVKCGWTRIIDHLRPYRGGHTNPSTGAECHEMLVHEQVSPLPIEVALLGEDRPRMSDMEIAMLASNTDDPDAAATAQSQRDRNAAITQRIRDEVYALEGEDVEALVSE